MSLNMAALKRASHSQYLISWTKQTKWMHSKCSSHHNCWISRHSWEKCYCENALTNQIGREEVKDCCILHKLRICMCPKMERRRKFSRLVSRSFLTFSQTTWRVVLWHDLKFEECVPPIGLVFYVFPLVM